MLQVTHTLHEEKRAAELKAFKLEQAVLEKTAAIEQAQIDMVNRLVIASESRHTERLGHIERISILSAALAEAMALPQQTVAHIRQASRLHDIGSITLPDRFFMPGKKLKRRQHLKMQTHASAGAQMLHGSASSILQMAEEIAYSHHERWDGKGYPLRLAGEAIPITARIVALTHTFDELLGINPSPIRVHIALQKICESSGTRFDPKLVTLLCHLIDTTPALLDQPERTAAPQPKQINLASNANQPQTSLWH